MFQNVTSHHKNIMCSFSSEPQCISVSEVIQASEKREERGDVWPNCTTYFSVVENIKISSAYLLYFYGIIILQWP